MPKKRQTVDIAAIRRQAEARGRELGRADLAVELRKHLPPGTRANFRDLRIWLDGFLCGQGSIGEPDEFLAHLLLSVRCAESLADAITEEANVPPFSD